MRSNIGWMRSNIGVSGLTEKKNDRFRFFLWRTTRVSKSVAFASALTAKLREGTRSRCVGQGHKRPRGFFKKLRFSQVLFCTFRPRRDKVAPKYLTHDLAISRSHDLTISSTLYRTILSRTTTLRAPRRPKYV
jgi:hypothetical protein